MSSLSSAAARLILPLQIAPTVRRASAEDLPALGRLMAPHIDSGAVLPRRILAEDVIVAELWGELQGCVVLSAWTDRAVELGALVSQAPGVGRLMVEAACVTAAASGFGEIVALTALPEFFERLAFRSQDVPPWLHARGLATGPSAVAAKARLCAQCPRLTRCRQVLMARDLTPRTRP